jgi:hypothetical protein
VKAQTAGGGSNASFLSFPAFCLSPLTFIL